jgi:histidine triad (HIT) family protein
MKNPHCIFCKIARGEVKAKKIHESDNFFVMLDANQKIKGHTLVIPKKHLVTLLDIPNTLGSELLKVTKKVSSDLLDNKLADGFNIIMNNLAPADQAVFHAHIHVIPRKEGDGLKILSK